MSEELRTEVYIKDDCVGYLYLSEETGKLSFAWSERWFSVLGYDSPFPGIPALQRGRITLWKVTWVFDSLYLPKTTGNIRRSLVACGLDENDFSAFNVRKILFVRPYREYDVAFGAPCSAFCSSVSVQLREQRNLV